MLCLAEKVRCTMLELADHEGHERTAPESDMQVRCTHRLFHRIYRRVPNRNVRFLPAPTGIRRGYRSQHTETGCGRAARHLQDVNGLSMNHGLYAYAEAC